jgi:hypothetical protein
MDGRTQLLLSPYHKFEIVPWNHGGRIHSSTNTQAAGSGCVRISTSTTDTE